MLEVVLFDRPCLLTTPGTALCRLDFQLRILNKSIFWHIVSIEMECSAVHLKYVL